jgi:pilus assembly protein CpaC
MHRTHCVPRTVVGWIAHPSYFWKLVLGLVLGGLISGRGPAQEVAMAPKATTLVVPINGTKVIQMSSRQNLKTVTNQDPNIARVAAVPEDPTRVQITGLRAGVTRLTLVDIHNAQDSYDVIVQTNVEHLRAILRQVAPTANIQVIPANETTIVLTGYVEQTEDIDPIVRTATAVGGYQIINKLRTYGVPQVELCVTVARVDRTKLRQLGFNFITNSKNGVLGSTVGNVIPPLSPVGVPSAQLQPTFAGQIFNSGPGQANLFAGAIFPSWGFLGFLQALEQESVVKLMAEPRLVTLSGRPASFVSGGEQAVPVPAGLGQVGVQFEEFGTRLNFLPIVMGNGKINLEVEPEVSSLSAQGETTLTPGGSPVLGRLTQRVHTTVELEDGQTFAIGGLIQHEVPTAQIIKIPVLGDLPFIGAAFNTKSYTEDEQELVVLVTPHLVDGMDCHQVPKVLPGEETRSPDDFELFLEGILEAPRGPREVFPGGRYLPAYKNGPSAGQFPCAEAGKCGCSRKACNVGPALMPQEDMPLVERMANPSTVAGPGNARPEAVSAAKVLPKEEQLLPQIAPQPVGRIDNPSYPHSEAPAPASPGVAQASQPDSQAGAPDQSPMETPAGSGASPVAAQTPAEGIPAGQGSSDGSTGDVTSASVPPSATPGSEGGQQ